MNSFISRLMFVAEHPLNQHRKLAAIRDVFHWQVCSRLWKQTLVFNWINNTRVLVSKGDTGITGSIYCGLHEFIDMSFVLHFLRADDLFFDIGANVGSYTLLSSSVRRARSVSFEPLPSTFSKLRSNVRINDLDSLVDLRNVGLGETDGELAFTNNNDTANHVVESEDYPSATRVPVKTLDGLNLDVPIMIKIDVEGFEWQVFQGAKKTLSDPALKVMIVEINKSLERYGKKEEDLFRLIESFGFKPISYDPWSRSFKHIVSGDRSSVSENNIIFVRDGEFVYERLIAAEKINVLGRWL